MKPKSAEAAAKEYSETNHCDQIVREIACRRAFIAGHEAGHASRDEEVKALREALNFYANPLGHKDGFTAREVLAKYPGEGE